MKRPDENYTSPYKILIQERIAETFNVEYLEVIDESYMHAGGPHASSHFKIVLVTSDFNNLNQVKRHQLLYKLFAKEKEEKIHSLSMFTFTPEEWELDPFVNRSPGCMDKTNDLK